MEFAKFKKTVHEKLDAYYTHLFNQFKANDFFEIKGKLLYPNILLFTRTENGHYIFELLGFTEIYTGLTIKYHKAKSTDEYLYQFEDENYDDSSAMFTIASAGSSIQSLTLSRPSDNEILKKRFGFLKYNNRPLIIRKGALDGPLIHFKDDFSSFYFLDTIFINRKSTVFRVKDINFMGVFNNNHLLKNLKRELDKKLKYYPIDSSDLCGVSFSPDSRTTADLLAGQFANLFLVPDIRETSIGKFLENNPNFLNTALKKEGFLYERKFDWIEGNDDNEEYEIRPDIMLLNKDGSYDICDLKTPKLNKKTLVKGKHKRARFHDYVAEGIAQLANYEEYFRYKKNQLWAKEVYGVKVDSPTLYLIVGNYENLKVEEVQNALRSVKDNYIVIDFDTLYSLFLNNVE